jgi:hypothetical protein
MKKKKFGPSGWEFDVRQMPSWKTTHPKQPSEGILYFSILLHCIVQ